MMPATENSTADLDAAIALQWTWKTPAMRAMTLAVVRLALARGKSNFSANDLPADLEHGGTGICGSVFRRLAADGILERVGHFAGGQFYQLRVRNPGGNPIGVYRLASHGLARALLRAQGEPLPEFAQTDFEFSA